MGAVFGITSVIWIIVGIIFSIYAYEASWKNAENYYQKIAIEKGYGKKIMIDSITGESKFFWADSLPTKQ